MSDAQAVLVCIGGPPASGKSSIIAELLKIIDDTPNKNFTSFKYIAFDDVERQLTAAAGSWTPEIFHRAKLVFLDNIEEALRDRISPDDKKDMIDSVRVSHIDEGLTVDASLILATGKSAQLLSQETCRAVEPSSAQRSLHVICIEDTFELESMRRPMRRVARKYKAAYLFVEVNVLWTVAKARNEARVLAVPDASLERVYNRFQHVHPCISITDAVTRACSSPGHACTLQLDGEAPCAVNASHLLRAITSLSWPPITPLLDTKITASDAELASLTHRVDLALRKWVSSTIVAGVPGLSKPDIAGLVNEARKFALEECRRNQQLGLHEEPYNDTTEAGLVASTAATDEDERIEDAAISDAIAVAVAYFDGALARLT